MASRFDLYQKAREAAYGSIRKLHGTDGLSWDRLSEWSGFEGDSSLKNIINGEVHNLDFARGCMLLKRASKQQNLRVHKHTLDTVSWEIVPRYEDVKATGNLEKEIVNGTKALTAGDEALQAGNVDALIEQYRIMQFVLAKMRAELENQQSKMRKW